MYNFYDKSKISIDSLNFKINTWVNFCRFKTEKVLKIVSFFKLI